MHRPPRVDVPSGSQVCLGPQANIPTSVSPFSEFVSALLLRKSKVLHSSVNDRLRVLTDSWDSEITASTLFFDTSLADASAEAMQKPVKVANEADDMMIRMIELLFGTTVLTQFIGLRK